MAIETLKKWLEDKDLRIIEARSGLRYSVLWRIKNGRVKSVSNATLQKLEAVIGG